MNTAIWVVWTFPLSPLYTCPDWLTDWVVYRVSQTYSRDTEWNHLNWCLPRQCNAIHSITLLCTILRCTKHWYSCYYTPGVRQCEQRRCFYLRQVEYMKHRAELSNRQHIATDFRVYTYISEKSRKTGVVRMPCPYPGDNSSPLKHRCLSKARVVAQNNS